MQLFALLTGAALLAGLAPEAGAQDVVTGQRLYIQYCAGCHGELGVNQEAQAPALDKFALFERTDEELADLVRDGGESMPPFLGILDDQEILDVINYLRGLH